ncbi:hypothetical protein L227DRAFT_575963 [Lentinus tigrinus ALCF2SS1-6]|uniref:DUF6533 domain-containing protein n=1 Tax=Lentinus tigrinus ALCF2SS1-6 TaxID=1328759 RepID=A0A5C2S8Y1_9APHY|nr:hypothetical protein L227DRAFT_575963 [Lentinus tigrinus ALCF2SS1-6]
MATDVDWRPHFEHADTFVAPYVQGNLLIFASACVFYYDYLLTIPDEVRLVWGRRFNLATAIFLYLRYAILIQASLDVVSNVNLTSTSTIHLTADSCKVVGLLGASVTCASFIVVSAFIALRLTALYSRNWYLGGTLFILGLLNPIFLQTCAEFGFSSNVVAPWPLPPCLGRVKVGGTLYFLELNVFPVGSAVVSIAYELFCLSLTAYKTYGTYRKARGLNGMRGSLAWLLFRDGSIYFAGMTILWIYEIVSKFDGLSVEDGPVLGRLLVLILTTRFISNLRQGDDGHDSIQDSTGQLTSTVQFNVTLSQFPQSGRFLGSLGGELQLDESDDPGDGDKVDEHV